MAKLAAPSTRSMFLAPVFLAVLVGCAHRIPPAQMAVETNPVKVQDFVWEAEYDGLKDGTITETEVSGVLESARGRWPERWEFQEMTASHYVRVGDLEQAHAYHEKARTLYMANPAIDKNAGGVGTATLLGGIVGGLIYAALTDDHVVEFPAAPDRETWSPPIGATYATAR